MDADHHKAVPGSRLTTSEQKLIVLFCALLFFPLLYLFRRLDANTLTSWRWIITKEQFVPLSGLLSASCGLAWLAGSRRFDHVTPHPVIIAGCGMLAVLPFFSLPELLVDSGRYFQQARDFSLLGLPAFLHGWGHKILAWTDLPLSAFFYGSLFSLFGETRIAAQIANLLLFGLALLLTNAIGNRIMDRKSGTTAAAVLAAMPLLLLLVPQMLNDLHVMVFLLITLFCLLRLHEGGGLGWSLAASLAMILFSLTKYSTWPMLLAMLLSFSLQHWPGPHGKRRLFRAAGSAMVVMAILIFINRDLFNQQFTLLATFQRQGLSAWQEGILGTFLYQVNPLASLLALYGAWRGFTARDHRFLLIVWWIAVAVLLGMARSRYLLPFLPLLALTAAYGMQGMEPGVRRTVTAITVLWGLVFAFAAHLPFLNSTSMGNLMAAGRFLNAQNPRQEPVGVLLLPQSSSQGSTAAALPLLDLYTKARLVLVGPADTDPKTDTNRYQTSLQFTRQTPLASYQPLFSDQPPHFLVILGPSLLQPDDPVLARLQGRFTELQHFARTAGPFRYRLMATILTAARTSP